MKSFLLVVLGVIIGVLGALLLTPVAVGVGAGAGIVTGVKTGACLTVEAAKERGFVTGAQVDDVLRAAGKQIASSTDVADKAPMLALSDAECVKVIGDLRKAAKK